MFHRLIEPINKFEYLEIRRAGQREGLIVPEGEYQLGQ